MKFYYENILVNQNKTAKTNVAWVADITEIELNQNKKLYILYIFMPRYSFKYCYCTNY